eukprot:13428771-Alexandrium_andersonii.AAC.1
MFGVFVAASELGLGRFHSYCRLPSFRGELPPRFTSGVPESRLRRGGARGTAAGRDSSATPDSPTG